MPVASWRGPLRHGLLVVGFLMPADPATAQQPDPRDDVLAVASTLFDAMRARDTAAVRSLFAPGARLVGLRTRADGSVVFQQLTVDQFVSFIGRDTRGEWLERAFHPEIRMSGTLATIWADYDFHLGGVFSHCGVDSLQLLRFEDGWKIVSLADTYVTTGCPERAAP